MLDGTISYITKRINLFPNLEFIFVHKYLRFYLQHFGEGCRRISEFSQDFILLNKCGCSIRGFNDAVNCFSEDGWALMNPGASDGVITSVKRTNCFGVYANFGTVICVKASLLLQVSCNIFFPQMWH